MKHCGAVQTSTLPKMKGATNLFAVIPATLRNDKSSLLQTHRSRLTGEDRKIQIRSKAKFSNTHFWREMNF